MLTYASLLEPIRSTSPPPVLSDQTRNNTPCTYCKSIALGFKKSSDNYQWRGNTGHVDYLRFDYYPDFPNLKTSAELGCACCALFRYSIRKNWSHRSFTELGTGDLDHRISLHAKLLVAEWDGQVYINKLGLLKSSTISEQVELLSLSIGPSIYREVKDVTVVEKRDTIDTLNEISASFSFKVYQHAGSSTLPHTFPRSRPHELDRLDESNGNLIGALRLPSVETLSKQNLELMSYWLHECNSRHLSCCVSEPDMLPTRVIDVGPLSAEAPKPYLLCSGGLVSRYAALSHCWGITSTENLTFKTEAHNYDELRAGMDLGKMSVLFQDAIVTTWKLGIQYLWIDSLCIIQDSKEDWEAESAKMGSVYRNAYVTIVATSATASEESFLHRSTDSKPTAKLPIPSRSFKQIPAHIYLTARLEPSDEGIYIGDVVQSTWNRRGWCLQEAMLSKRLLHFCKNKIYFECRAILTTEENETERRLSPAGISTAVAESICLLPLDIPRQQQKFEQGVRDDVMRLLPKETLTKIWETIMRDYSKRQLTYPADKLPALSGLASHYAKITGQKYLAGLWYEDIHRLLLWSLEPQVRPKPLPPGYRAPSWSWASLDGPIIMPLSRSLKSPSLRILEAATRPSGPDDFGAVESGHLKILGLMLKIDSVAEYDYFERFITTTRFRFPYDLKVEHGMSGEHIKVGECHLDRDDCSILRPEIWYLEVYSGKDCIPTGLVLQTTNNTKDEFLRVGLATMNSVVGAGFTRFTHASVLDEAQWRTITIY